GRVEAVDTGRHAGVDGEVHHHLDDLLGGAAVAQRPEGVDTKLVLPIQGPGDRDSEKAPGLPLQLAPCPYRPPTVLGHQLLELRDQFARTVEGGIYVLVPEHLTPDGETLLEIRVLMARCVVAVAHRFPLRIRRARLLGIVCEELARYG